MDPISWAKNTLNKKGYGIKAEPEIIQKTPYSRIILIPTIQGNIYLKQTPPALFIEVEIIQLLKNKINDLIPTILDANKEIFSFLMLDAGIPLRDYLKTNFQSTFLFNVIKQYTALQFATANDINTLLKIGLPDWRLDKLPALYQKMINMEEVLRQDGLEEFEFIALKNLVSTFNELCEKLSKFNIPETLDHCDFHDNNILINLKNDQITLIDLGEVVIAHPFFSLLSFISKTAFQYSLTEHHPIFVELLKACYQNWFYTTSKNENENENENGNENELIKAMLLAKKIWPIYSALGYYRLISSSGMGMDDATIRTYFGSGRNAGRFAKYFRDFIDANLNIDPSDLSHVSLVDPGSRLQ